MKSPPLIEACPSFHATSTLVPAEASPISDWVAVAASGNGSFTRMLVGTRARLARSAGRAAGSRGTRNAGS
jgi:hypothetical protein